MIVLLFFSFPNASLYCVIFKWGYTLAAKGGIETEE